VSLQNYFLVEEEEDKKTDFEIKDDRISSKKMSGNVYDLSKNASHTRRRQNEMWKMV
jgi:hypothetical protein